MAGHNKGHRVRRVRRVRRNAVGFQHLLCVAVVGRHETHSSELGGVCLVTADHGNAEQMLEPDGVSPHTAHTTNRVPLVVTAPGITLPDGGEIADLAPTTLDLLGLDKPVVMTGRSLVNRS